MLSYYDDNYQPLPITRRSPRQLWNALLHHKLTRLK